MRRKTVIFGVNRCRKTAAAADAAKQEWNNKYSVFTNILTEAESYCSFAKTKKIVLGMLVRCDRQIMKSQRKQHLLDSLQKVTKKNAHVYVWTTIIVRFNATIGLTVRLEENRQEKNNDVSSFSTQEMMKMDTEQESEERRRLHINEFSFRLASDDI